MISSVHLKELLSEFGSLQSQAASEWTGELSLPNEIAEFYNEIGPVELYIEAYGNPFYIPRLSKLWEFQAGYRWNGMTGEPSDVWNDDWIVVADESANPFIFSRTRGTIWFAQHGQGAWKPIELFPNIYTMAACLAEIGRVIVGAGNDFADDMAIRPKYANEIISSFTKLLGSKSKAEQALKTLFE